MDHLFEGVKAMVLGNAFRNCQDHALLTDLYELTMAYAYWKSGSASKEAVFHLSFRKNPFDGGYAVFCGLQQVVEYLKNLRFDHEDLDYLSTLANRDGSPLFEKAFLEYLRDLEFELDVDSVPEGTIVFGHEPLIRVRGPIIQAQLVETTLLNYVSFSTLVATKAARIKEAGGDLPVFEFGLRRAQGPDGGITASLAAYIGGCDGTSNVLAGRYFKIPVVGTHAHSWVMSFPDETSAFSTYAEAMPKNCYFLVDTYDTVNGVKNAVEVGRRLRAQGGELLGVRLDSGDLAYLSIETREILDEAGFENAKIVASNNLDEDVIKSLRAQGAKIDVWAVGTKLVTCDDQPSLGAVYKLSAVKEKGQSDWTRVVKVSEQSFKTSNPGILQVRRFHENVAHNGSGLRYFADMIFDEDLNSSKQSGWTIVDPTDFTRRKLIEADCPYTDLLKPLFRKGELIQDLPDHHQARAYALEQMKGFHEGIRRLLNPHQYPVGLEIGLYDLKTELILKARGLENGAPGKV